MWGDMSWVRVCVQNYNSLEDSELSQHTIENFLPYGPEVIIGPFESRLSRLPILLVLPCAILCSDTSLFRI